MRNFPGRRVAEAPGRKRRQAAALQKGEYTAGRRRLIRMKSALLLLLVSAAILVPGRESHAEEIIAAGFPVLGGEYVIGAEKSVLPPEACDKKHIVILEHGFGPWFKVAYNRPSRFSWKPPEVGTVWINFDRITWLELVPEDCRCIRLPRAGAAK